MLCIKIDKPQVVYNIEMLCDESHHKVTYIMANLDFFVLKMQFPSISLVLYKK